MIVTLSIVYGIGFALSFLLAVVAIALKVPAGRSVLAAVFWPITLVLTILWAVATSDERAGDPYFGDWLD